MTRFWRGSAAVACAAIVGCAGPTEMRDQADGLVEPFEPAGELALGERAFMRTCHQCHPGGEAGLGPSLIAADLPDGAVRLQVRQGLGAMPSFDDRRIPGEELDAIVAYLDALYEFRAARAGAK